MICVRARTMGATSLTAGHWRTISSQSCGVRVNTLPAPKLTPPLAGRPGLDQQLVGPHAGDRLFHGRLGTLPISIMAITAPTPIITPKAGQGGADFVAPQGIERRAKRGRNQRRQAAASRFGLRAVDDARPYGRTTPWLPAPDPRLPAWAASSAAGPDGGAPVARLDPAVHNVDRAMCVGGHLGIVRHQHDGDPFGVELLEHPQDFHAGVRIEVAGRLVGQDQRRVVDQRTADRHPLLLSAGHLRRLVIGPIGQAHAIQAARLGQPAGLCRGRTLRRNSPAA